MFQENDLLAYGPVPSRRLGQSLGINNIPPKVCTNSCVYCQAGRTSQLQTSRAEFYKPKKILKIVEKRVRETKLRGAYTDYLTFVSNGEPTLDRYIGYEIDLLKSLHKKIAVITNASLLWRKEVRESLYKADLVSVKIDTVSEEVWRETNRPHGSLELQKILNGILEFSNEYSGELLTETMIIKSMLFKPEEIEKTADFVLEVNPRTAYLSVPTRPPAENWVEPPTELELFGVYISFYERGINVAYLAGYEGNNFASTGNVEEDLLGITSVHPMREDAVNKYLKRAHQDPKTINALIKGGKLKETYYNSTKFYIRSLSCTEE